MRMRESQVARFLRHGETLGRDRQHGTRQREPGRMAEKKTAGRVVQFSHSPILPRSCPQAKDACQMGGV